MTLFTKRIAVFTLSVAVVLLGAWLGGVEFVRGPDLLFTYVVCIGVGLFLASCSYIKGD